MIEFILSHYLQRYHSADVIYNAKKSKIPKEIIKQIMVIHAILLLLLKLIDGELKQKWDIKNAYNMN